MDYLQVIKTIAKQLSNEDVKWAITGSANFALQGVPITPADIDIQTDKYSAYKIENIFKEHSYKLVRFSSKGLIRSHFGALCIEGIRVEIMGDIEKLVEGKWEETPDLNEIIKIIIIDDVNIPVLSLEYEAEAYMKLGRENKAKILHDFINKA